MNKYEFVPAAIDSLPKNQMVGVRYKKNNLTTNKHSAAYHVEPLKNSYVVHLADRSVYFLRSNDFHKERLTGLDFDVLQDLDYFMNKGLLSELGYNYAMVNSQAVPKRYHYEDFGVERKLSGTVWPEIIADSGGFQIRTGVEDFLSPKDTVQLQNKVASIGISLDIPFPLTHTCEVPLFRRAALVQKANNDVYKKYKSESLSIMNVIHGPNFHLLDRYREVVEDPEIDRVSIGGVRKLELTPLIFRLLNVILKGRKYRHYHALGVSGVERWVLLCYIAHKNIADLITSDSTTYLKGGFNAQFFETHRLCYARDLRSATPEQEQYRRLACSCPICSTIGFSAPVVDRKNPAGITTVIAHNLFLSRNYLDEIYQVTELSHKELLRYLKPRMNERRLQSVQVAMSAVDMALQDGLEKAASKYSPYLLRKDPTTTTHAGSLFKDVHTADSTTALRERVDKVLTMFEEHHGMKVKK